jgi:DNA-binding response OmpR family regulator
VVEDDPPVAGSIVRGLKRAGFAVELVQDGGSATERALAGEHDLIILDLMLPERSGFEVLEALRDRIATPIVVLSARSELDDRLRGFDLGAVDYLTKPFWMDELVARVRTRLRVRPEQPSERVGWADVVIDMDGRRLLRNGDPVALTRAEFDVLAYLVRRPGRAVARQRLTESVLDGEGDSRTVDSHVARVRRKLGPSASAALHTVWGIGYRFEPAGSAR